ncbi:ABC-F family ATP-binding cassette domain-containing protein [Humibacter ginsenosidimutans]|uniref:ABC-F family ATP-binding cassette domain-containing protein n=1 Tax=Humibacter ginsenosidimutans TaxID=2599293 RepID=A0A5B8M2B5_9MICO|nr:ABC-F family ATP-binding cassette domain-containing protein [Humibacter ginsenosidimutans]QDZ14503.1 ABC-F family ATP-binding cassette domain-containing protein [Humibacter ginsenosidimutans]
MAHLLGAEALHLEYPTKVVFDSVSLGVNEGDRIGIVGRNGDGKSSLLAMLAGRRMPDSGRVTVRGGIRIGVLDQEDMLDDDHTVAQVVVGDTAEHEWAGDARVRDVIAGLLGDIPWEARIGSLSGGQRRRVALAALLAGDWDVLALDEPTNHLDVEAITWLAQHLKRRWSTNSGGLLVVTHDRWFLDEICTATWEVHDRVVEPFDGGYAAYILQRVERDRMAAATEAKRQNLARKELAWLRRGAPARTSKPKFRIDAANALIEDVPPIRDSVSLKALAVSRLGKEVVDLVDASVSYPVEAGDGLSGGDSASDDARADAERKTVLRDVEWRIAPGERTGILGVNGAGKSTLLGLVAGTVQPTDGRVKRGKTVKVASLTQRLDELEQHLGDPVRVVLARLRTTYTLGSGSKAQELTPGQMLERLGFSSAQLSTPVKDLSGGQKRRLQLLLILLDQPNVLILDEPTNDLDTDMLAAMEDLLDSWPGTLIVVSHDRYFIERVTDQQYAILDSRLRHLPGGVDEYLKLRTLQEQRDAGRKNDGGGSGSGLVSTGSTSGGGSAGGADSGSDSASASGAAGLQGAALRDAQKEVASIERRIAKLTERIDTEQTALAEHDQGDYEGLLTKTDAIGSLQLEASALEERWFELTELIG